MNPFLASTSTAPINWGALKINPFTSPPPPAKIPFAATPAGTTVNTAIGLTTPAPYLQVAKDIAQGIARSAGSAGLTVAKPFGGVDQLSSTDVKTPFLQTMFKAFFGTEPIKPIEDNIAQAELAIRNSPFAQKIGLDKMALPLAFGGVFGGDLLNLTPFGGLEKNAVKLLVETTTKEAAREVLTSLKVPEELATKFAPHFAEAKTPAAVQDVFDNMKGVLGVEAKTLETSATDAVKQADILPTEKIATGAESTASQADQALLRQGKQPNQGISPLTDIVQRGATGVKEKVNVVDYLRTPDRVLEKIGFGDEAKQLRQGYEAYIKELPLNIEKISAWAKQLPAESGKTIFQYLDGQPVALTEPEHIVATEIKSWLKEWAQRLKLPEEKTITNYITHVFDKELIAKEFNEELAKIITDKIPGSVYDPFLEKRLGANGYKENVWEALDAYVKRGTRKVNMDQALEAIQRKAGTSLDMSNIEASQFKYVQRYVSGVNMRPTELDNLLDNTIKSFVGYKYGQRPVTYLTKLLRQLTYRGMLGLNPGSALRNLSQGINTYAVLGERYTTVGYLKLFSHGAMKELAEQGVFAPGFIQDRTLSSTKKTMARIDKGLFAFFEGAERINRGAAYFGAKSKALAQGKSPEQAVDYAKAIVRKTQFSFGSIDTPVALQSDIVKTVAQFQNYTVKQTEFLAEMAKDKNVLGLLRYAVAGLAFVYTVGKAFGMNPADLIPSFRVGTPPSLKLPVEAGKAALNTPDKFNRHRSVAQKASDVGKAVIGLIPGGTQAKKSIEGLRAYNQGKDVTPTGKTRFPIPHTPGNLIRTTLFGKSSLPQAKDYYANLGKAKTSANPFLK